MGWVPAAQGVPGGGDLQAQKRHDAAGVGLLQAFPLVGVHAQDAGHLFGGALERVVDLLAHLEAAGIKAHIGEALALVHHDFKGQARPGGRPFWLPGFPVRRFAGCRPGWAGTSVGLGRKLLDAVQEGVDAFVAQGGAAVGGHALQAHGGPVHGRP